MISKALDLIAEALFEVSNTDPVDLAGSALAEALDTLERYGFIDEVSSIQDELRANSDLDDLKSALDAAYTIAADLISDADGLI